MSVYILLDRLNHCVKIGTSNDVSKRIGQIQTGSSSDLQLIRLLDGDARLEKWFHKRYAKRRIRGEWFEFIDEMLTVIVPEFIYNPKPPREKARFDSIGAKLADAKNLGLLSEKEIESLREYFK